MQATILEVKKWDEISFFNVYAGLEPEDNFAFKEGLSGLWSRERNLAEAKKLVAKIEKREDNQTDRLITKIECEPDVQSVKLIYQTS
jgi:hypothetical protein